MVRIEAIMRSRWGVLGMVLIPLVLSRWIAAAHIVPNTPCFDKYVILADDFYNPDAREPFTSSPVYSAFLGGLLRLVGNDIQPARIMHLILGGIGILLLTWAACRLWDNATGLAAGLLGVIAQPSLIYDSDLVTTGLETPFTAMLILFLINAAATRRGTLWLLSGITLGLLSGIRPNASILTPVLCMAAWVSGVGIGRRFRNTLAAAAGIACAVLPITFMNVMRSGEWIPVTASGGAVLYSSNNYRATGLGYSPPPALTELENTMFRDSGRRAPVEHALFKLLADRAAGRTLTYREASAQYEADAVRFMRSNPRMTLAGWVRKTMYLINSYEVLDTVSLSVIGREVARWFPFCPGFGTFVVLGVCGIALVIAGPSRASAALSLLGVPHLITGIVFYVNGRLRAALLPVLVLFAAYAVRRLLNALRRLDAELWLWIPTLLLLTALVNWEDDVIRRHRETLTPAFRFSMEGLQALKAQDLERAEVSFRNAVTIDPFDAREAWANLAVIYSRRGNSAAVEQCMRRSGGVWTHEELATIVIPPFEEDRLSADLAGALASWRVGDREGAAARLNALLDRRPGHPDILYNLAVYAASRRTPPSCDQVIRLIDQALDAGLKYELISTRARNLKADCLTKTGRDEDAGRELNQVAWEAEMIVERMPGLTK